MFTIDIRIVGENIKSISYSVIKGTSLDFYRVKSLDLFHDDLSELNKKMILVFNLKCLTNYVIKIKNF